MSRLRGRLLFGLMVPFLGGLFEARGAYRGPKRDEQTARTASFWSDGSIFGGLI
jgi:hypothetical protein